MKTLWIPALIAGLFPGLWGCLMCMGQIDLSLSLGMVVGYLTMLIGLSIVFLAVKRRRDLDQGGVIRFWPAFGLGLAISAVACIVYALMFETALLIAGYDVFADGMLRKMQAEGATAAEMAEGRAMFAGFFANPVLRIPIVISEMLPVGVLVSLVSAALLRNPRFMPAREG